MKQEGIRMKKRIALLAEIAAAAGAVIGMIVWRKKRCA